MLDIKSPVNYVALYKKIMLGASTQPVAIVNVRNVFQLKSDNL